MSGVKQGWIDAKIRKAQTGAGERAERSHERVPPGQRLVKGFPVLDLGRQPAIAREAWRLEIGGAVENPATLDWAALRALQQAERKVDLHCVTHWTRLDTVWRGVPGRALIELARPQPGANFVVFHSSDDYTTNVPIEYLADDESLLAHTFDGAPLSLDHGGPVRVLIPKLYLWKSAKWVKGVTFHFADELGYWEVRGYHALGDPWREQRYARPEAPPPGAGPGDFDEE